MVFSFGQSELDRIEVDVLGYERAPVGDYWDDNWLKAEFRVQVGGFRGNASGGIQTSELTVFLSELHTLYESLSGSAEIATEGLLRLRLVGDGMGHIGLQGEVADQAGIGNRLHFSLKFDQTQLKPSIRELERVVSQFPERTA